MRCLVVFLGRQCWSDHVTPPKFHAGAMKWRPPEFQGSAGTHYMKDPQRLQTEVGLKCEFRMWDEGWVEDTGMPRKSTGAYLSTASSTFPILSSLPPKKIGHNPLFIRKQSCHGWASEGEPPSGEKRSCKWLWVPLSGCLIFLWVSHWFSHIAIIKLPQRNTTQFTL